MMMDILKGGRNSRDHNRKAAYFKHSSFAYCKRGEKEKALPLVFFIHGFTSAKEHNLHFAYLLAEKECA